MALVYTHILVFVRSTARVYMDPSVACNTLRLRSSSIVQKNFLASLNTHSMITVTNHIALLTGVLLRCQLAFIKQHLKEPSLITPRFTVKSVPFADLPYIFSAVSDATLHVERPITARRLHRSLKWKHHHVWGAALTAIYFNTFLRLCSL